MEQDSYRFDLRDASWRLLLALAMALVLFGCDERRSKICFRSCADDVARPCWWDTVTSDALCRQTCEDHFDDKIQPDACVDSCVSALRMKISVCEDLVDDCNIECVPLAVSRWLPVE